MKANQVPSGSVTQIPCNCIILTGFSFEEHNDIIKNLTGFKIRCKSRTNLAKYKRLSDFHEIYFEEDVDLHLKAVLLDFGYDVMRTLIPLPYWENLIPWEVK